MVCKNCGNVFVGRNDCLSCGYDPTKDDPNFVGGEETVEEVALPPVEIILKTKTNVAAILALVASILSCIPIFPPLWWITEPICWIVGLVLALIGLSAAKTCRKGKGYAIAALCVCAAAVLFAVVWVIAIFVLSGATVLLEMLASGLYEF